jgi:hypothetical protein
MSLSIWLSLLAKNLNERCISFLLLTCKLILLNSIITDKIVQINQLIFFNLEQPWRFVTDVTCFA